MSIVTYYAKEAAAWLSVGDAPKSAQSKAPRPEGRRRDPARRGRQAADEPAAVGVPARPGAVRLIAAEAELELGDGSTRTQPPARQADHPRDHPDLRHPRARLQSMLVAAKVDSENPQRAAADGQRPSRRLAQLPAHPRLQPLVHDRHAARLRARPGRARSTADGGDRRRVDAPAADPDPVQDQHEPGDGEGAPTPSRRRGRRRRPRASSRPSPTTTPTSP